MDFPIADLMDENSCYEALVSWLHPQGLVCPDCGARDGLGIHRRHREPVVDYQCDGCGRVFNAFTGTVLHAARRSPSKLILILRGIAQGESTAQLAREVKGNRPRLLELRHRLQDHATLALPPDRLMAEAVVEADEMYQNAGEKRRETHRSGGSAAASGQQRQGSRHMGKRSPTGARCGRTRRR